MTSNYQRNYAAQAKHNTQVLLIGQGLILFGRGGGELGALLLICQCFKSFHHTIACTAK